MKLANVRRALHVTLVLVTKIILPGLLPWRRSRIDWPVRWREALETLGGAWTKLGQALALRFDLLPPAYCYELFKLLNQMRPFPIAEVRRILREELKAEPERLFREFDERPFAAASIGQVHRAVLRGGERVAVKVQRPRIRQLMHADIHLMKRMAGALDFSGLLGATRAGDVIEEFARWTREELDFRNEARSALRLAQNAEGDPNELNARVFREYSTERVLTTAFLDGIPLVEIVSRLRAKDEAYLGKLRADGHDLRRIATHICWNTLNQVYAQGFFHADLHPANLFVLPRDRIGYVDFGITGRLTPRVRDSLGYYARHLFEGDTERATLELMQWMRPSALTDIDAARKAVAGVMDEFLASLGDPHASPEKSVGNVLELEVMAIIRDQQMSLAPEMVTYLKAVSTLTSVIYELAPDFDLAGEERRFFGRMISDESRAWLDPHHLVRAVYDLSFRAQRALDLMDELGGAGEDISRLGTEVRRRIQWLGVFAVAASGLFIALVALPQIPVPVAMHRTTALIILGAVLVLLIGLVVHQARRLPRHGERPRRGREALRRRY